MSACFNCFWYSGISYLSSNPCSWVEEFQHPSQGRPADCPLRADEQYKKQLQEEVRRMMEEKGLAGTMLRVNNNVYVVDWILFDDSDSVLSNGKKIFSSQCKAKEFIRTLEAARDTLKINVLKLRITEASMTLDS
jgi:hypothetical protein